MMMRNLLARSPPSRLGTIAVVALILAASAIYAVGKEPLSGDFRYYYGGGDALLAGHPEDLYRTGGLGFRYLPFLALYMAPVAMLPPQVATFVWVLLEACAIVVILWVVLRAIFEGEAGIAFLAVLVAAAPDAINNLHLGQINLHAAAWAFLGLLLAHSGRQACGGALLGLGAAIKFWPALVLLGAIVARRPRIALGGVAAFLIFAALLPSVVLGWGHHADLVSTYLHSARGKLVDPEREQVVGQSLQTILQRYLSGNPYQIHDGAPRAHTPHLDLPPETTALIGAVVAASLLVVVLTWFAVRPARETLGRLLDVGILVALWLLLSPETRNAQFLLLAWPWACWVRVLEKGEVPGRARLLMQVLAVLYFLETTIVHKGVLGRELVEHLNGHVLQGWTLLLFTASLLLLRFLRRPLPEQAP
ncbi:MAG: glycosyltransferase family 87 protein [Planctomycetota bacterium]